MCVSRIIHENEKKTHATKSNACSRQAEHANDTPVEQIEQCDAALTLRRDDTACMAAARGKCRRKAGKLPKPFKTSIQRFVDTKCKC